MGPSKGDVVTQPETLIKSGASFGIAGDGMSVVFTGEAPPNMPNRPVSQSCLIEWDPNRQTQSAENDDSDDSNMENSNHDEFSSQMNQMKSLLDQLKSKWMIFQIQNQMKIQKILKNQIILKIQIKLKIQKIIKNLKILKTHMILKNLKIQTQKSCTKMN